jgi:hypothetical protein
MCPDTVRTDGDTDARVAEHPFSVASARAAARADRLAGWVADFLSSPGSDNAALAELLTSRMRVWAGPVQVPIGALNRLAGPSDAPVLCAVDDEEWDDRVDDMEERIGDGWEPPPVIVTADDGRLILEDGNHRVESLRRNGRRWAWAIVGAERRDDLAALEAHVG